MFKAALEYRGKSVFYITDTEHVPGAPDCNLLGLIAGADVVIYDSLYTDDAYAAAKPGAIRAREVLTLRL